MVRDGTLELRIEVYIRCTIFTLFKTWKLENEVHIREPPVLIITIRLSSRSRSLPFSSAWYNRSLFSPPLCTGFPFSSARARSARSRPPAEDWIPPGITVPYSVLHSVYIYMSKPPHYSCFSAVWGGWPEVNRKRCFWKTLLLHHTFYNISKNHYIISELL